MGFWEEALLPLNGASREVALSGRLLQVWLQSWGSCQALGDHGQKTTGPFPWESNLPGGKYSPGDISVFVVCVMKHFESQDLLRLLPGIGSLGSFSGNWGYNCHFLLFHQAAQSES